MFKHSFLYVFGKYFLYVFAVFIYKRNRDYFAHYLVIINCELLTFTFSLLLQEK